ncbi:MAG: hypothetical protein ACJ754_20640 [Pyrinomonadaceae bacterium]
MEFPMDILTATRTCPPVDPPTDELLTFLVDLTHRLNWDKRLVVDVLSPHDSCCADAYAFVEESYRRNGPAYLLSRSQQLVESRLEMRERSTVFIARDGHQVIHSVLRATPFPFEANVIMPGAADGLRDCRDHVEINRFTSAADRGATLAPLLLMVSACRWALEQRAYSGLIGLTRLAQQRLFSRFGLRPVRSEPFIVPQRGSGEYWLLKGQWHDILPAAVRYFGRPSVDASSTLSSC